MDGECVSVCHNLVEVRVDMSPSTHRNVFFLCSRELEVEFVDLGLQGDFELLGGLGGLLLGRWGRAR